MKCREFHELATERTLAQSAASPDEQMRAHQRECAECASWLQQREMLAAAIEALRVSTAQAEAGAPVEAAVLRAFRQAPAEVVAEQSQPAWLRLNLGGWFARGAFAAVAAVLAIAIGLGVWAWQRSGKSSPSAAERKNPVQQFLPTKSETQQPVTVAHSPSQTPVKLSVTAKASIPAKWVAQRSDSEATQAYVPLMLCDPLSCSGDEQVVRMEIPAAAADGLGSGSEPLLADVVVGDDGLVRAIRIVQQ
jgi:hypothetical protein